MSKEPAASKPPQPATWAEEANYWKTGDSPPESWIEKAKKEILAIGGTVLTEGFVAQGARAAYLLSFEIEGQRYDAKWPVLPSKKDEVQAARRQAASALFYDVKARVVAWKFQGPRAAFLSYLVLPSGMTAAEASNEELAGQLPDLMRGGQRLPPPRE